MGNKIKYGLIDGFNLLANNTEKLHYYQCQAINELQTNKFSSREKFIEAIDENESILKEFLEKRLVTNEIDYKTIKQHQQFNLFIKNKLVNFTENSNKIDLFEILSRSEEFKNFSEYYFDRWRFIKTGKQLKDWSAEREIQTRSADNRHQVEIQNLDKRKLQKLIEQAKNRLGKLISDYTTNLEIVIDHELVQVIDILYNRFDEILLDSNLKLAQKDKLIIETLHSDLGKIRTEYEKLISSQVDSKSVQKIIELSERIYNNFKNF